MRFDEPERLLGSTTAETKNWKTCGEEGKETRAVEKMRSKDRQTE